MFKIAILSFRFGRVPALETLVDVHKGEELFSHYKVKSDRFYLLNSLYNQNKNFVKTL